MVGEASQQRASANGSGPGSEPGLELTDLRKSYRRQPVLQGLTLRARRGEITSLIGPNGAGKSTTLQAVAGLVALDSGAVRIAGVDAAAHPTETKRQLGYAPQELSLSPFLTGMEFLAFVAEVRGLVADQARRESLALLERFHLLPAADRLTREYSEGMSRKLSIAAAVLGTPPVVVLDETLNGLDPQSNAEAAELLGELARAGVAVLLTTHILAMVAALSDRVFLLHEGVVALELDRAGLQQEQNRGRTLERIYLDACATQPTA